MDGGGGSNKDGEFSFRWERKNKKRKKEATDEKCEKRKEEN